MFLGAGFGVQWWDGGWAILVHEKGFWPGDLGAEVLLNAVILGELVVEVQEAGREWQITREDVAGYLGRS